MQRFPLQFDVSKIIVHEADEPDAVVDLLCALKGFAHQYAMAGLIGDAGASWA